MTIKEAMEQRHTVRKYKDKPIPSDLVEKLNARIAENNQAQNLSLSLVTGNADGFGTLAKMLGKGIRNYIILGRGHDPVCADTWPQYLVGRWNV